MWGVALVFVAVASCNAELYNVITADLPKSNSGNRIIGGSPTIIENYPFAVQVLYRKKFHCGGSLLSARHVLSAAHCFVYMRGGKPLSIKDFTVRVGTTTLNSGGSVHLVKDAIIHELYNYKKKDYDVAVVVMTTPVDFNTSVAQRTRIARKDAVVPDNSFVTTVGWGRTNESIPDPSKVLMEVTVRKISLKTCRTRYRKSMITNNMICAGILNIGGKDACSGDSGGPLLYEGTVVGITSWGIGCARPKYPGVYARVAIFTNWIIDAVKKSQDQKRIEPDDSGSRSNKVGAITLLTPLLYLILSVYVTS